MTKNSNQSNPDHFREDMVPEWFQLHHFPDPGNKVDLSDDEWKKLLSDDEYRVLRMEGTEPAHTGIYSSTKSEGVYICRGCSNPLFPSISKYNSGTGWPSFYAPISYDRIGVKSDHNLLMERTEVHCARCGGHLGHVFEDGPNPTGLRYCLNSPALRLIDKENYRIIIDGDRKKLDFELHLFP